MFKNESGKYLSKALFFELTLPATRQHAVFTLKEDDHTVDGVTYKSLKKLFLSYDDPTEYKFASECLGGWQHWKELQSVKEIAAHIESWREERDIRLQSMGVTRLITMAADSESSFQAAKWLADKGWKPPEPKGRPSKAAIQKETERQAKLMNKVEADLALIGGHDG